MRLSFFLVCAGSLINRCCSYPLAYTSTAPVAAAARTKNGTYTGVRVPQLSQEIFRGIPFAHAPRFSLAESLTETWSGFRDAIEPGLTCSGFGTNNLLPYLESGEDCLNLNVVRPAGARPGAKLPVLVWIYGGGYRQGSVNDREFNTSFIVQNSVTIKKPVIVVSINYRLSMFGFVYSIEVQSQGITNLGIRDQWKALEWIKENIGGFGGDPDNVSIWGESAGAFSIGFLTMAYGGDNSGLFQKAIAVSGSAFGVGAGNPITAQTSYDNVANATGCYYAIDSLQCMRELPFATLNATLTSMSGLLNFQPMIDGDIIRNSPSVTYAHKPALLAPVDILIGCNTDEGMSEALGAQIAINTSEEFADILTTAFGLGPDMVQEVLKLWPEDAQYPPYSEPMSITWPELTATVGIRSGNQTRRIYGFINDYAMQAGRRLTAQSWSNLTGNKVYSFRWDVDPSRIPLVYTPGLGVGFAEHGAELSFEFALPYVSGSPYPSLPDVPAMRDVSYAMQVHFISFANYGDPNKHGLKWIPQWPAYTQTSEQNFVYNATLANTLNLYVEKDNFRKEQLDWLNARWRFLNKG